MFVALVLGRALFRHKIDRRRLSYNFFAIRLFLMIINKFLYCIDNAPSTLLLLVILTITTAPLIADETPLQSHNTIEEAIKRYLLSMSQKHGGKVNITVGRLDSRLRLRACTEALSTFSPPGRQTTGKTTVGVRCDDSKPWTIYVAAQVGIMEQIVIANKNLPRGTHLTAEDLYLEERDVTRLHRGYLTDISQAANKTVLRMVRQGTPLSPSKINAPTAIKRGADITILSKVGSIEVRMRGTALGSGSIGDQIKVKNSRSKRLVNAQIISSSLVRVGS